MPNGRFSACTDDYCKESNHKLINWNLAIRISRGEGTIIVYQTKIVSFMREWYYSR